VYAACNEISGVEEKTARKLQSTWKVKNLTTYHQWATMPRSPLRYLRKFYSYVSHFDFHLAQRRTASRITLPAQAATHVEALRDTGFSMLDSGELPMESLREIDAAKDRKLATFKINTTPDAGKNYWREILDSDDLTSDGPFVRLALHPRVIEVATAYLGQVPHLAYTQIYVSYGTQNSGWQETQSWHADYDDTRMIKLWVYLTDVVSSADGPFTYIPAQYSRKIRNAFLHGRFPDEEIERRGLGGHSKEVIAPKFSGFFVDTARCLHRGSRLELGKMRVAFNATYIAHASLNSFRNKITTQGDLTPLEKTILFSNR
jgi:hypothetical protein